MTARLVIALGCFAALQTSCVNPGYVDEPNSLPIAVAKVVDPSTNMAVETMINVPFSGAPVAVTFDGSASTDAGGRIVSWRWIAGDMAKPDMRVLSPVATNNTPRATLMLGEGNWTVSLWVTDDKDKVSTPDTVKLVVGMPAPMGGAAAPMMPTEAMCLADTVPSVPMACKACMCKIESCRTAVVPTACGEPCWAFIRCIASKCPTFVMDMNITCLQTNCGAEYVAYMGGPQGAQMAGACARMCPADCAAMPTM